VDKFSRKIPKGFVEDNMEPQTYYYSDKGFNDMWGWELHTTQERVGGRFVIIERSAGVGTSMGVGRFDVTSNDLKRMHHSEEYDDFGDYLKKKPTCLHQFSVVRSSEELDGNERYGLRKGTDAVIYMRKKRGASWIRYEAHDLEELFSHDTDNLIGGREVPLEQVQRYADLAERFFKTYSVPKGELGEL
jgi:hypothetical protein